MQHRDGRVGPWHVDGRGAVAPAPVPAREARLDGAPTSSGSDSEGSTYRHWRHDADADGGTDNSSSFEPNGEDINDLSDLELVVNRSSVLETLLERVLGAEGLGLHGKAASVQVQLPKRTVHALHYVARWRDAIVRNVEVDSRHDRQLLVAHFEVARAGLQAFNVN